MYKKGLSYAHEDMDIGNILDSIVKLKAGLAAVIDDKTEVIDRARKMYFSNATIYEDPHEELHFRHRNKTYEFLNQSK